MKNILIGGAWPYANGSLHIGHIAGLLPGDVIARYFRLKGNTVFYVSGSDCHGTPVTIKAKQESKTPSEISNFYHEEFVEIFKKLGFRYDLYGKTTDKWHIEFVKEFHKKLYESDYISERLVPQAYCPKCDKVLTDRLVTGFCPTCNQKTRGDQCDNCGAVHEAEKIIEAKCSECGSGITFQTTKQLYLEISKLKNELKEFLKERPHWRKNAVAFTKKYIDEGLRDRAITRKLDWGIDVPKPGYEDKKIYIWAENVLGYLSASKVVTDQRGIKFDKLWGDDSCHYYVHGKDNIPFHTIILPSLLIAHGENFKLPDFIISNEHLTLEGKKISTSQNWAIWVKDIVDRYNADSIRYFFLINGPEKRDTDFSWREFVERNNSELLGAYGNFVNRTLAFNNKYFNNTVPEGKISDEFKVVIENTYKNVGEKIENGSLKEALENIFELVREGNKYFDKKEPWKTRLTDLDDCKNTIFNCIQLIANLSVLLSPFIPFSSQKIQSWLNIEEKWFLQQVKTGYVIPDTTILFERIDRDVVETELQKLGSES